MEVEIWRDNAIGECLISMEACQSWVCRAWFDVLCCAGSVVVLRAHSPLFGGVAVISRDHFQTGFARVSCYVFPGSAKAICQSSVSEFSLLLCNRFSAQCHRRGVWFTKAKANNHDQASLLMNSLTSSTSLPVQIKMQKMLRGRLSRPEPTSTSSTRPRRPWKI